MLERNKTLSAIKSLRQRPRRLRRGERIRRLVRETNLQPADLIAPMFVVEGKKVRKPIESMPGVFQVSVDEMVLEAKRLAALEIGGVILFGLPTHKDEFATQAHAKNGIVPRALASLADKVPDLVRVADVCLCEYTTHGHCGVVREGEIVNDESVEILARAAVQYAAAGADIVAPSDMMDGRVKAIRDQLDAQGHQNTAIMSYAVKYASSFYAPFREAAESAPQFGDRRSYQMDPSNVREAMREAMIDEKEGADILLMKPAGYYLDLIARIAQKTNCPLAAFQVSGEYSMIKAAGLRGWIDENAVMMESLVAIKRAGARIILTYFAAAAAEVLRK